MSEMSKRIHEAILNSRFCLARSGGQGYVHKDKCTCERNCQAIQDKDNFHALYGMGRVSGMTRAQIIQHLPQELKDGQWYKDNVKE